MPSENQKQIWLDEALMLVPEFHGREELRTHLTQALKRCHSNSRKAFWQFLRLTLAKNPDTVHYLYELQESRVPPEAVPTSKDDFQYEVSADGKVALIPVGDADHHGIWKIALEYLDWALAQFPVWLKRLPDLEPVEVKRQREIKHSLRYSKFKMTKDQVTSLRQEVGDLDAQVERLYKPVPRYCLMKSENGHDAPLHRLFVGATEDDEIEAINGDFLDFTLTKIRVTLEPVPDKDGVAGGRGESETRVVEVNNLQIVPMSAERQKKFEDGFYQFKRNDHGEILVPYAFSVSGETVKSGTGQVGHSNGLQIAPNADLGKVWNEDTGKFEHAGKFDPLMPSEKYAPERYGRKPVQMLNPDVIRRAWRASRRLRGVDK